MSYWTTSIDGLGNNMRRIASAVISTALFILSVAGASPAQARPDCDVPHPPPVCGDGEPGIEPLEPPTGLVADPNPPVTLRWYDNSSDEAGFRIYRSADGSHWDLVASLPEDIGVRMTYTDGTAAQGVVYRYYVQVFRQDQNGESTGDSEVIFALNHLPQGGMFGWHRDSQKRLEIVGGVRDPDTPEAIQVQLTIRENRDVIIRTMIPANQTIDNDDYFANHEYDYHVDVNPPPGHQYDAELVAMDANTGEMVDNGRFFFGPD